MKITKSAFFAAFGAVMCVSAQADTFGYTGSIVDYTVATSGNYYIDVAGAQGGSGSGTAGGLGAWLEGEVYLTAGTELGIVVGGEGSTGNFGTIWGGGGGGGSFVYIVGSLDPLVVAGGGSGAGYSGSGSGIDGDPGQLSTSGDAGFGPGGGAGGTGGFGGGGGGGWQGGGGGGGYSGGGGGDGTDNAGGGGGSYIDPSVYLVSAYSGVNSGDGYVELYTATPGPAALLPFGAGLAGAWLRRRKAAK